ncbi:MAG: hypothetical protein ACREQ7_21295 [Candidatus Binatia bacterium]
MKRRLLGVVVCLFLGIASTTATYTGFTVLDSGIAIYLPPSFFSLDAFDDFADTGYPDGVVMRQAREKFPLKLPLGFKVKIVGFNSQTLQTLQNFTQPFSSRQELYRYKEVFRI